MSSLPLPDPTAAYFRADTQGPDHMKLFIPLERGLMAHMEISV